MSVKGKPYNAPIVCQKTLGQQEQGEKRDSLTKAFPPIFVPFALDDVGQMDQANFNDRKKMEDLHLFLFHGH